MFNDSNIKMNITHTLHNETSANNIKGSEPTIS